MGKGIERPLNEAVHLLNAGRPLSACPPAAQKAINNPNWGTDYRGNHMQLYRTARALAGLESWDRAISSLTNPLGGAEFGSATYSKYPLHCIMTALPHTHEAEEALWAYLWIGRQFWTSGGVLIPAPRCKAPVSRTWSSMVAWAYGLTDPFSGKWQTQDSDGYALQLFKQEFSRGGFTGLARPLFELLYPITKWTAPAGREWDAAILGSWRSHDNAITMTWRGGLGQGGYHGFTKEMLLDGPPPKHPEGAAWPVGPITCEKIDLQLVAKATLWIKGGGPRNPQDHRRQWRDWTPLPTNATVETIGGPSTHRPPEPPPPERGIDWSAVQRSIADAARFAAASREPGCRHHLEAAMRGLGE